MHDLVTGHEYWSDLTSFVQFMMPVIRLIRIGDSDIPIIVKVSDRVEVVQKTQLMTEERKLEEWVNEMRKFTDKDELVDADITAAAAIEVMQFKNSAHELLLYDKYMNMHFYDNDPDVDESRKVVIINYLSIVVGTSSRQ